MATVANPPVEQRIVLHDISWDTYERLLADHVDSSAPRFTYDRGELEILSPSTEHEKDSRILNLLVEIIAMELSLEIQNVGSMTFKREPLRRGFEPDSSFYIQHEEYVCGRKQIDLTVDPPPDLIIEIEITRSAIPKLPIYAALGVPEVWRWDGERITLLRLVEDAYVEVAASDALPFLTSDVMTWLMTESRSQRRVDWTRLVREWIRGVAAS